MFTRYIPPSLVVVILAGPSFAQRRGQVPQIPGPIQANPSFRALFKPVVERACLSTVRIELDGKDAVLGTVVADGFIVTKASELKAGKLSIKTHDGRDFDAKRVATSDAFDVALLKVDGTGLVPIKFGSSSDAPAGNWLAVAGVGTEPVAIGVVGAGPRSIAPPYRGKLPANESGFLGVQLEIGATRAIIEKVTDGSAAAKAGIHPKDMILQVEDDEIADQETLINTLQTYRIGDKVKIRLERGGKPMELLATLGKRPAEPGMRGGNRGDMQNMMGSKLSNRRSGIPRFLQTDAVIKPSDCGAPAVDLDGHVIGIAIARAGRTESDVIPSETIQELLPILYAANASGTPDKRVDIARAALKKAESAKAFSAVIGEGRRLLGLALAEEKWWKDHPIEKAPAPHTIDAKNGPASHPVGK